MLLLSHDQKWSVLHKQVQQKHWIQHLFRSIVPVGKKSVVLCSFQPSLSWFHTWCKLHLIQQSRAKLPIVMFVPCVLKHKRSRKWIQSVDTAFVCHTLLSHHLYHCRFMAWLLSDCQSHPWYNHACRYDVWYNYNAYSKYLHTPSASPDTVEPEYYGHLKTNQKCPDYQGGLIFQVSLYDKAPFGTITKGVDYAGVLISKCPD